MLLFHVHLQKLLLRQIINFALRLGEGWHQERSVKDRQWPTQKISSWYVMGPVKIILSRLSIVVTSTNHITKMNQRHGKHKEPAPTKKSSVRNCKIPACSQTICGPASKVTPVILGFQNTCFIIFWTPMLLLNWGMAPSELAPNMQMNSDVCQKVSCQRQRQKKSEHNCATNHSKANFAAHHQHDIILLYILLPQLHNLDGILHSHQQYHWSD